MMNPSLTLPVACLTLLVSASLWVPAMASAQQLSLQDAQTLVQERAPAVEAATARVRASEAMLDAARSYWRPTLVATAGYQYDSLQQELVPATLYEPLSPWLDAIAVQTPGLPGSEALLRDASEPIELAPQHALRGELALTQPLLAPGASAARRIATARVDVEAESMLATIFALRLAVTQTFFEVLRYERLADAVSAAVAQADAELLRADVRVREGVATPFELDAARTQVQRAHRDRRAANTAARTARDALHELVGAGLTETFLAPEPTQRPTTQQEAEERALANNPELGAAHAQRGLAERGVDAEVATLYPSAQARLAARAQRPTGVSDERFAWTASVGVEWTIFAGGARSAQREAANAQLDASTAHMARVEARVRGEVRRLWIELEQADVDVALAAAELTLAERALELARSARAEGVATNVEVEVALERRNGAERARVVAGVRVLRAEALLNVWVSGT